MSSTEAATPQERKLATNAWWLLLVDGILAVIFGIVAIAYTSAALTTIMVIFGIFSVVIGAVGIYAGIKERDGGWGWLLFQGVASLVVGILALRFPSETAAVFTLVVAFWALAAGLIQLVGAFDLRKQGAKGWGWTLTGAVATLIFGLIFLINPGFGAKTLVFLLGLMVLIAGIVLVIYAFMVRKVVKDFADDGVINSSNA